MGTLYHKSSPGLTKSGGTINDYGAVKLDPDSVGAIAEIDMKNANITIGSLNGTYVVGCRYYTDATTLTTGLFYDDSADSLQKAGYFVTPKIFSQDRKSTR